MKYYTYIFVRQDLSPEQQIVQASHAAFKLGVMSQRNAWPETDDGRYSPYQDPAHINPDKTHFVVVGVRNLQALEAVDSILHKFGYRSEFFYEDAISEVTACATYPVREDQRDPLHAFNLLKMK